MKTRISGGLAIASGILLLAGCGGGQQQQKEEEKTVLVSTKAAESADVEQIAVFTANIEPYQLNNIAPNVPGRIDAIHADVGANVVKGQVLAIMDRTQYNAQAANLAVQEADFQRLKAVYEAGGLSQSQFEGASTALKTLREAVRNLKENTEISSPVGGTVTARNYYPGDLYNGQTPILTVMQMNPLKVTTGISEQFFTSVRVGQPADIKVELFPNEDFTGKVSLIHPAINTQTRTFTIEITIPNNNLKLRPGMFARTTLNFGSQPGVLVEDLAVQKQSGSNERFVFVAKDGKAHRRTVTIGRQVGTQINVLSGVEAGEEVILNGFSRLFDGAEIEIGNRQ